VLAERLRKININGKLARMLPCRIARVLNEPEEHILSALNMAGISTAPKRTICYPWHLAEWRLPNRIIASAFGVAAALVAVYRFKHRIQKSRWPKYSKRAVRCADFFKLTIAQFERARDWFCPGRK